MKLMSGNSNPPLVKAIGSYLDLPITDVSVRRFADEEVFVEIHENVRGEDVFVVQSTSYPANDNLMELLICIDALRRASAKRITAVLPYFGYARQDRKPGPRTPISAKLVANLITVAGANRVLSIDLHAGQIQGFFDIPTDNLYARPSCRRTSRRALPGGTSPWSRPDVGGVVRARALAKRLNNAPLAIVDKRRERPGESEVMNIIGDVRAASASSSTTSSIRQARSATPPRRSRRAAPRKWSLTAPTACFRARGAARRAIGAERARHHRFDRDLRSGSGSDKIRILTIAPAAGGGDPPHRRRKLRVEPVRLMPTSSSPAPAAASA
jgi:hypothetical protein